MSPDDGHHAGAWWVAVRDGCYIGMYCNTTSEDDLNFKKKNAVQYFVGDKQTPCPRRKVAADKSVLVLVTADSSMPYGASDAAFFAYVSSLKVSVAQKSDELTVTVDDIEISRKNCD